LRVGEARSPPYFEGRGLNCEGPTLHGLEPANATWFEVAMVKARSCPRAIGDEKLKSSFTAAQPHGLRAEPRPRPLRALASL